MRRCGALLSLVAATALARAALAQELVVIVHADREVRLTRAELARIYLRQRRFWENGEAIVPINRDAGSEARAAFTSALFGKDARRLDVYWNRRYFEGVLPPATLASDEAVKRFVASERLAIGYVAPALVDASVRVVLRLEPPD